MPELAFLNGEIIPIEQAMIPVEDRGYQFGDALYEVIASYEGRLFCLEEHLDRLASGMSSLNYPSLPRENLSRAISKLFNKSGLARAALYIQISRGVAPRDHSYSGDMGLQMVMTVRKVVEKPLEFRQKGASAITVIDTRWARCDIKTVQLLSNSMAKQKALDNGAFDAIFVTGEGIVREATSSNVFIVADGRILTHPLTRRILPGITRKVVLDICRKENMAVEERFYTTDELFAADEVFLSGTISEILPITSIDGQFIGNAEVGPATARLYDSLLKRIRQ